MQLQDTARQLQTGPTLESLREAILRGTFDQFPKDDLNRLLSEAHQRLKNPSGPDSSLEERWHKELPAIQLVHTTARAGLLPILPAEVVNLLPTYEAAQAAVLAMGCARTPWMELPDLWKTAALTWFSTREPNDQFISLLAYSNAFELLPTAAIEIIAREPDLVQKLATDTFSSNEENEAFYKEMPNTRFHEAAYWSPTLDRPLPRNFRALGPRRIAAHYHELCAGVQEAITWAEQVNQEAHKFLSETIAPELLRELARLKITVTLERTVGIHR